MEDDDRPDDPMREERVALLRRLVTHLGRIAPAGPGSYSAPVEAGTFDRVYGGQIIAEGLMAAAQTVPASKQFNSVHCHFLRLGNPTEPIVHHVEEIRDSRSFSVRMVRAEQAGRTITAAAYSFAEQAEGLDHQWAMPATPDPETTTPRDRELIEIYGRDLPPNAGVPWPIDLRHVDRRPWDSEAGAGHQRIWMRADERLPDDPVLHTAVLLYASDLTMVESVIARHPIDWEDLIAGKGRFGASLDHAFWMHAPVRADDWLLHVQESPRGGSARGFCTGRFFDRSGILVASVAQEIFIRSTGEERV